MIAVFSTRAGFGNRKQHGDFFSLIDRVSSRPLPFEFPSKWMRISLTYPNGGIRSSGSIPPIHGVEENAMHFSASIRLPMISAAWLSLGNR